MVDLIFSALFLINLRATGKENINEAPSLRQTGRYEHKHTHTSQESSNIFFKLYLVSILQYRHAAPNSWSISSQQSLLNCKVPRISLKRKMNTPKKIKINTLLQDLVNKNLLIEIIANPLIMCCCICIWNVFRFLLLY